jgi:hypothetical protein
VPTLTANETAVITQAATKMVWNTMWELRTRINTSWGFSPDDAQQRAFIDAIKVGTNMSYELAAPTMLAKAEQLAVIWNGDVYHTASLDVRTWYHAVMSEARLLALIVRTPFKG